MADELTGPGTPESEPEVRLVHSLEDAATPDTDASAEQPAPPVTDHGLARHFNVNQLPAEERDAVVRALAALPPEAAQVVEKRMSEVGKGVREVKEKSDQELAELRGKVDALTQIATGSQPPPKKELPDWVRSYKAPDGASEAEVLFDFVQYVNQHTVVPKLQQAEQVAYELGMERVNGWLATAKQKTGSDSDWETVEPKVQYALERGLTPDEALDFALANTGLIGNRIRREIATAQSAKAQAVGGSISTPGVARTDIKSPDPRTTSAKDYHQWAASQAMRDWEKATN